MPRVKIDKHTRWECQHSGKCCHGIILEKSKSLSVEKDGKMVCRNYDDGAHRCSIYKDRPYICKLYPFSVDFDKMKGEDGVLRPHLGFSPENMYISTECPGYGKGKRVMGNQNLLRKMDALSVEFATRMKKAVEEKKGFDEVI